MGLHPGPPAGHHRPVDRPIQPQPHPSLIDLGHQPTSRRGLHQFAGGQPGQPSRQSGDQLAHRCQGTVRVVPYRHLGKMAPGSDPGDGSPNVLDRYGLGEEVDGTAAQGPHRIVIGGVAAQHDERDAEQTDQFQAIAIGQLEVADHHLGSTGDEQGACLGQAGCSAHNMAIALKSADQRGADAILIFDQQDVHATDANHPPSSRISDCVATLVTLPMGMGTAVISLLALVPDPVQRRRLAELDLGPGLVLHICGAATEAERLARRLTPDVVLAGHGAGATWLNETRIRDADAFRILWCNRDQLDEAVAAVNQGDADAILRGPFEHVDAVALLHHGCEQALLRRHTRSLVDELAVRNAELLGFNERLEDLVSERTRHLVEAQDRLQESQRQMIQLETQSTVNHLLRGLAHEFNNPLAAIYGYTQRLRRQLDANADAARRLDVILQEVEHCRTVVHQLRQLGTPLSEVPIRTAPTAAMHEGLARLVTAGRNAPLLEHDPNLPDVIAAPRALVRVFEEVLANASEAGAGSVHLYGETHGEHVRLMLVNDGETPDETTVANAVRPFFTTRAAQDHRGLGLSTAAALLHEQDGTIELLRREDGHGAVVVISLPAADAQTRDSSKLLPAITTAISGAPPQVPTTLVIDDEPMVAELLVDALREAGCTTATAGSVAEAMAELTHLNVCALVVDLHLPDGSGLDLARRALALKPALAGHIALATGDADREHIEHLIAEHGFPVLAKPFRLDEVRALAKRLA